MRYFTLNWAGIGGTDGQAPSQILEGLELNPFAPLTAATEMEFNFLGRWQPYDRETAIKLLHRGKEPHLTLHIQEPDQGEISLICHVDPYFASLSISEDQMREHDPEAILHWLRSQIPRWPHFSCASADGALDWRFFRDVHQLPNLPGPNMLQWAHLLPPRTVAYDFESVEVFLKAPAYRVRQLEKDGLIELVVYADPLSYNQPETQQRIIEVVRYLDSHRHDRYRRPPD